MSPRTRIALVVAGCLVSQMGLGLTYLFDTYLREIVAELDWSRASFSAAHSSRLVVLALVSPMAGWATERFGARVVLGSGLVVLATVGFFYGRIDAIWQLWLLSPAIGFVMAALGDVAVASVITSTVPGRSGLALGLVYSGSNIGGMLAVTASAAIVEAADWRASALYLVGGASLALLPFVLWAVRVDTGSRPLESGPDAHGLVDSVAAPQPGLDLAQALRTRSFWLLFVALTTFYFYYISILDHLVAHLQDIGLSRSDASQAFGLTILLGVGSKLGIGVLFDRFPARLGLLVNFGVLAVASVLLVAVPAPGMLTAFVIGHGAAVAAQNVTYPMVVADCFGVEHVARIYGALMLALLVGGVTGSILSGAVFDATGSYRPVLVLFAGLNLASIALLAFVQRERVDPTSALAA